MTRDQMKVLIERLYLIWNTGDLSSIPRSQRRHLDRPCRRSSTGHDTALRRRRRCRRKAGSYGFRARPCPTTNTLDRRHCMMIV